MKVNQSLTAAITAVALVAGAGFAYAQSGTAPGAPGDLNSTGTATMKAPATPDTSATTTDSTLQAQPSTSTTGTTMDNSAPSTMDTTLEPRADRN